MLSEEAVKELYERKMRQFARTGRDRFLYEVELLKDILEVSTKDYEQAFEKCFEEVGKDA